MSRRLQTVAAVTCMKMLLILFTTILMASGFALLCMGLWMKISLMYMLELSNEYNEIVPYVFIGTGTVIVIGSFFACFCSVKGQPILLYLLSVFFGLAFLFQIVASVSGYIYRGKLQDGFKTGLNSSVTAYGRGGLQDRDIDMLQKFLKCCGVEDYSDWYTKWGNHTVPKSCCQIPDKCQYSPVEDNADIYTEGCYVKVVDFINRNLGALFGGAVALATFNLFGVILSCYLAKYINKAKYEPVA